MGIFMRGGIETKMLIRNIIDLNHNNSTSFQM